MRAGTFSFIVTGAGRGGTSLLGALLGSHPETCIGFERHMEHLMGRIPESANTVSSRLHAFRTACDDEASQQPKIWGNKITTEQIAHLTLGDPFQDPQSIPRFFDHHQDLKNIFILRDGRTCVQSKIARTGISLESACRRWQFSVRVFQQFQDGRVQGKAIKFEHLLADPVSLLRELCDFLGLSFSSEMLKGTNHPGLLPEYRRAHIDRARAEVTPLPDEAMQMIEPELRSCGYVQ